MSEDYAKRYSQVQRLAAHVEQAYRGVEDFRKLVEQKLLGMVVSATFGHQFRRIKVTHVTISAPGRVWLSGPIPTKTGWHSRNRASIPATLPFTIERDASGE